MSTTGTPDDDDDPSDEHADENEAPVRETNDATETPEEFVRDDDDVDETDAGDVDVDDDDEEDLDIDGTNDPVDDSD